MLEDREKESRTEMQLIDQALEPQSPNARLRSGYK